MEDLATAARSGIAEGQPNPESSLDEHTSALVIVGAALCSDSPTKTLRSLVESARRSGATDEEILGVLLAVAPAVGESRLVAVSPRISKALGYDVDEALEYG